MASVDLRDLWVHRGLPAAGTPVRLRLGAYEGVGPLTPHRATAART